MPRVLVLGSGRQAFGASFDLIRFLPEVELTLADASPDRAESLKQNLGAGRVSARRFDATSESELRTIIAEHDAVLSCLPYPLNPLPIRACLETQTPYVDLGTEPEDIEKLQPSASGLSVPVVYDAGLAPGLINQLASWLIERNSEAREARLYCGGLPESPVGPLRYYPYFSLTGLVGEYADPALAIVDGQEATLPSLTGLERVQLPGVGELEAFVTSGGASDAPARYAGKLQSYQYKTLRYPGHLAAMELLRDLGMWSEATVRTKSGLVVPIELFETLMIQAGSPTGAVPPDRVLLHVAVGNETLTIDHRYDHAHGLSAMEQLTGFSGSIVLQAVLAGRAKPGLRSADDAVSGQWMADQLRLRNISVLHQ